MRKTREILRQKSLLQRSHREVARSVGVSLGAISQVVARAGRAGLDWAAVCALDDEALEARIHGPRVAPGVTRVPPDPVQMHTELKRSGVTRELLYREYREAHPDGYSYSKYCEYYFRWLQQQRRSMRQEHRAGEKMFVDYAGKKPSIVDPETGECIEVELFVAVLGASNYTFAEVTRTQKSHDWIASHVRALEFFGGVPPLIVPDQLKSGVTRACRYEPEVQRTYEEFARHYGTTVLPARPAHPRDKAKVEVAVQISERWIVARLRNVRCFSVEHMNEEIRPLLDDLNARPMKVYKVSRRDLFEQLDRPLLSALPAERFVYAQWKEARVNIDYHVELQGHYYSVPHTLVHQTVLLRFTESTVEIFTNQTRVASHVRNTQRGRHTTIAEHMPKAHQKQMAWTPSRLVHWASTIGPSTEALVEAILKERAHPEQGYRSCLGILRLGKRYGHDRLEAAAERALQFGARSYRHLESILQRGLDRTPLTEAPQPARPTHGNVRGPNYYH